MPWAHTEITKAKRREEGAALLLTLLVLAILVVLVVQFTFSVKVEQNIVQNAQDDIASELAARGVAPVLEAMFKWDRTKDGEGGGADTLADIVFDPHESAANQRTIKLGETVEMTFEVEDLERRLPLHWLSEEGPLADYALVALSRLIQKVAPTTEITAEEADSLAEQIKASVQGMANPGAAGLPEGGSAAPPPGEGSSVPMRGLYSIEQLIAQPATEEGATEGTPPEGEPQQAGGVPRVIFYGNPEPEDGTEPTQGIAPFVTAWPVSKINLNTVLPEVLFAILPPKSKSEPEPEDDNIWAAADGEEGIIEKFRKHRIDPDMQSAGADGEQPAGGAEGGGGQGASGQWEGTPLTNVDQFQDEAIHEVLKEVFNKAGEGEGEGDGDGGGGGDGEETQAFKALLTTTSQLYAVRVKVRIVGGPGNEDLDPDDPSAQGPETMFRLIVHRGPADEVSVLMFETVPE